MAATVDVSEKQAAVMAGIAGDPDNAGWTERWNVISGPVRSGKTHAAVTGFAGFATRNFMGHDFIAAARQFRLIKSNLRPHFQRAARDLKVPCRWVASDSAIVLGSNKIWCVDGSNTASADKIQGLTASGAILDEAAIMPEAFVQAVGERCSEIGAKIVMTCNPREPRHWLKTKYIDRGAAVDCRYVGFHLGDNPTLDLNYIENLIATHEGSWLKRNVLGQWVEGEGLIWPIYTVCDRPAGEPWRYVASVDAADRTVTHVLLAGIWHGGPTGTGQVHIVDEWHHDARTHGEIPVDDKVAAYVDHITAAAGGIVDEWLCDRYAYAELKILDRQAGAPVHQSGNAPNTREESIDQAYVWLQRGIATIDASCEHLIHSIQTFTHESQRGNRWNRTKTDHGADALKMLLYDIHHNSQGAILSAD